MYYLAVWLGGFRFVPGDKGSLAELPGGPAGQRGDVLRAVLLRPGQSCPPGQSDRGTDWQQPGGRSGQLHRPLHRAISGNYQIVLLVTSLTSPHHHQGLRLTFPVDNSLQGCYSGRPTCVREDLGGEVSHLLSTWNNINTFLSGWLEVGNRLLASRHSDSDTVDVEEEIF